MNPPTVTLFWFNGQFYESDQFQLSPFHPAFTVGEGLFETLRGINGHIEALPLHLERLQRSARLFGFSVPDIHLVRGIFTELMGRLKLSKAKLRLTVSHDILLLTAEPLPDFPESMAVVTLPFTRNENDILKGIKSTSYSQNTLAQNYAAEHDADEVLFGNNSGNLCEGSYTNVFVQLNGHWMTPPLSAGPLPGVTRRLVLDITSKLKIKILEQDLPISALSKTNAMFITSSLRGVMPIHSIDKRSLAVSPDCQKIENAFSEYVKTK